MLGGIYDGEPGIDRALKVKSPAGHVYKLFCGMETVEAPPPGDRPVNIRARPDAAGPAGLCALITDASIGIGEATSPPLATRPGAELVLVGGPRGTACSRSRSPRRR